MRTTFFYIAFVDLASRRVLFTLLQRIGCPKLLKMTICLSMTSCVVSPGSSSSLDSFPIKNRAKQGCILAPTLFGISFILLSYAFSQSKDGIYIHT